MTADALEAEARTDPAGTSVVPLDGQDVHVLPVKKWKSSAIRALRAQDFDLWAEKALAGDDYAKVWAVVDPDMEQVEEFFTAWKSATGQDPGK